MFHIVLTTTCQIYYITFYLNFFLFVNFFLMCYIIFIKCKINQHLNTRDTVCFYLTSTMGVTCGIFFFIVSTTQKQTGGNLTWVFSLTEIQRSASWSASSVKNSISSSCRSLISKCSSPSSLSKIAAISTHTHTEFFKQWSACRLTRQQKTPDSSTRFSALHRN